MMRSRLSIAHRSLLDVFEVIRALKEPLDVNPWRVDQVRIEFAGLYQMLDLGDREARRRRHHRIEVARGAPVDQVADGIALPGFDEGKVGVQGALHDKVATIERFRL